MQRAMHEQGTFRKEFGRSPAGGRRHEVYSSPAGGENLLPGGKGMHINDRLRIKVGIFSMSMSVLCGEKIVLPLFLSC